MSPKEPASKNKRSTRAIQVYWAIYGGWWGLLSSPYLWVAVGLTAICAPLWQEVGADGARVWARIAVGVIPNLLGFSVGGMAILLAFSSPRFLKVITQAGRVDSLFMRTVASFFHFILLQTLAVCVAFISLSHSNDALSALGFLILCYGTLVAVAVASLLLNIARLFNAASSQDD